MPARPTTVDEYIEAAPKEGRAHFRGIREILQAVAPEAEETIKWNAPFYIEPRFLFSFNANKAHLNFAPGEATLAAFADELKGYKTTRNYLQVRYDETLPEDIIRRLAEHQLHAVSAREDESFW